MAKNYQDIYNSVYVTGNKMDWTNAMIRGNGIPLDIYSIFNSYNDAVIFAATNAVAYEGQVLAVTENGDTTVYVITPAKQGSILIDETDTDIYLKEVGSATLGDDKTIVLTGNDTLSLKNFGVKYYAYNVEKKAWDTEVTEGWKEGLQPKVINSGTTDAPVYELAWFEPSSTTVEGLSESIGTLSERVATAEGTITSQGTLISNNKTDIDDIKENKADKATTLAGYGITDAYSKEEINGLVSGAFHFRGSVDYYGELVSKTDMVEGDVYIVKYVGTEGTNPLNAEYAYDGENWVEFGSTIDLSGYSTKDELAEVKEGMDANTEDISDINNPETGILAQAKSYTDEKTGENKQDIEAINNSETGILAQAKAYTDEREVEIKKDITTNAEDIEAINNSETGILAQAKAYTDEREVEIKKDITTNAEDIEAINNSETGILAQAKKHADDLNTAMDTRVTANTESIDAINNAETGILKLSKDYTDSQRSDLNTTLTQNISTAKTEAITESKSYTDTRETEINLKIQANTNDIADIKNASTGILSQSKNYTDTQLNTAKETIATDINTAKSGAISEAKTYTDTEIEKVNNTISTKVTELQTADATNLQSAKDYTDQKIATAVAASNAMVYKGTVGEGGTVTELPTTNVKNGDTYKVLADGVYAEQQAFIGDMFIAVVTAFDETVSIAWTLIPSGDDGNVNTTDTVLTDGSLVIGKGNKEVTTLANGTNGQILKVVDNKPAFVDEKTYEVVNTDESITVSSTTEDSKTSYNVSVNKVSTDKLIQGDLILVLNGGTSAN